MGLFLTNVDSITGRGTHLFGGKSTFVLNSNRIEGLTENDDTESVFFFKLNPINDRDGIVRIESQLSVSQVNTYCNVTPSNKLITLSVFEDGNYDKDPVEITYKVSDLSFMYTTDHGTAVYLTQGPNLSRILIVQETLGEIISESGSDCVVNITLSETHTFQIYLAGSGTVTVDWNWGGVVSEITLTSSLVLYSSIATGTVSITGADNLTGITYRDPSRVLETIIPTCAAGITLNAPTDDYATITTTATGVFSWRINGTGSTFVDWGDGENDTYDLISVLTTISHTFSASGHTIKVYNIENLTWFYYQSTASTVTAVTIPSSAVMLKHLGLQGTSITSLVTHAEWVSLYKFWIYNTDLTTVETHAEWVNLDTFYALNAPLTTLVAHREWVVMSLLNSKATAITLNADINNILIEMDESGMSSGSIDLSGGTNACPTGLGLIAKANLIARGVSVTTNWCPTTTTTTTSSTSSTSTSSTSTSSTSTSSTSSTSSSSTSSSTSSTSTSSTSTSSTTSTSTSSTSSSSTSTTTTTTLNAESEYEIIYNAMVEPPDPEIAEAQEDLVDDLIIAGVWQKSDILYVFAQQYNDNGEALINWVNPGNFDATESGTLTWTSFEGYQGGGLVGQVLATGYTPSIHADNYIQDSASFGFYSRSDIIEARTDMGTSGSPGANLFSRQTSTQAALRLNTSVTNGITGPGTSVGMFIGNRILSTHMEFWHNGVRISNISRASTGMPPDPFYVLGAQLSSPSTKQLSMAFVGGGLTSDEIAALTTAWSTYDNVIVTRVARSDEYNAVLDAMTTRPSAAVAAAQNTFVETLVSDGVWSSLDFMYVFAQEHNTGGEALINWIDPGTYDAVAYNSPTFTSLEGFTGNGTNAYISTGFIPSTHGVNYTLGSSSFGLYSRTNKAEATYDMSAASATSGDASVYLRASGDIAGYKANDDTTITASVSDSSGFFVVNRTSFTQKELWRNGINVSYVTSVSPTSLPDAEFKVLTTLYGNYSTRQLSLAFGGQSLSGTDIANFMNAFETYMDAMGTGVIT